MNDSFPRRHRGLRTDSASRRDSNRLHVEVLEERRLLSVTANLLRDIRPAIDGSSPTSFVSVGPIAFFAANDGTDGQELWKSDGTTASTVLVKDILPGALGSSPSRLTNVNGTLFFRADDGSTGFELWKSNGTDIGTTLVKDIFPAGSSSPGELTNVNGTLFFTANNGTNGSELWKSDGTAAGTVLVKDINPTGSSSPIGLTNVNGTLFFTANDGTNGSELWKSDGTTAGTVLVQDINPGSGSSLPNQLFNLSGTLFFSANDGTSGYELWKTNGTATGTVLVQDIRPGSYGSYPSRMANMNDTLFFSANDGTSGYELWRSDGTSAGTTLVQDSKPGSGSSYPVNLANVNGELFFSATNNMGLPDYELWKSDGTNAGTALVKNIRPNNYGGYPVILSSYPSYLTNVNGTLYFSANDGSNGYELWTSDGTDAGTLLVQNINPASASSSPINLANVNGTLFFAADDGTTGVEPWVLHSSPFIAGTALFYKGSSKWNVTNGTTFSDDNAIAPDKMAYLPGSGTSAFSAVSSYDKGINGLMVDISGPHGAITASDFIFKVGNNNSPSLWTTATAPTTVTTRVGAGASGSDRVELMWANNAIQKQWLEVVVKGNDTLGGSNTNTGLASSYVFYFGNALGDAGVADSGAFSVTSSDEINARNNPKTFTATRSDVNDFNRDGSVNSSDQIIARNNTTSLGNQLKFLVVGGGGPFVPDSSGNGGENVGASEPTLAILRQTTNTSGDGAIASGLAMGSSNGPRSSGPGLPVWLGLRLETLASPSNATSIRLLEGDSPPLVQIDDVVDALDDDLLDLLASLGE